MNKTIEFLDKCKEKLNKTTSYRFAFAAVTFGHR